MPLDASKDEQLKGTQDAGFANNKPKPEYFGGRSEMTAHWKGNGETDYINLSDKDKKEAFETIMDDGSHRFKRL